MCCSKRRNKQQQQQQQQQFAAATFALAGAADNKYQQHKLQQQTQARLNERNVLPTIPSYPTTTQPTSQHFPFELDAAKLHSEERKKLPINPPSYDDTIVDVNRAMVPDDDAIAFAAQPTMMKRKETEQDAHRGGSNSDSNSSSSSNNFSLDCLAATLLPQEKHGAETSMIEIPKGMTWWQAYRARKAERREAWRAEKAEWRAAKRAGKGKGH
ncbi:hypothetical protein CERZMDRAFT_100893 [Cercospora zeae-maydis SCOH1-5]|uniref:Uncharacterized protein n=1 Tax=Cercospora zeae-maydis SCOH1-5 TaxID=717836 RepID=A0A6A6F582_9PEZI|nr:hypothetical protein CERZMDRAFT_100893 [Cercospora zeae-maydis SCOH1-5]